MALIILHLLAWFPIIVELTWWIRWIACFLSVVLLSVWIALCFTRRQGSETLTSNVVFSFGIFISQCLLTEHRRDGYEHGLMQLFVVLCHCNIHPAALFIGLVLSLMEFLLHALRNLIWNPSGSPTSSLLLISEGLNQVFVVLVFVAFSVDFTHRVNNVLAKKPLRGDHMFDSPKKRQKPPMVLEPLLLCLDLLGSDSAISQQCQSGSFHCWIVRHGKSRTHQFHDLRFLFSHLNALCSTNKLPKVAG